MGEAIRLMFAGAGSLFFASFGEPSRPGYRITLPPDNSTQAIGFDFSQVARDLKHSMDKIEGEKQLEFKLNP